MFTGNPDALSGAPPPKTGDFSVNGTTLYAEIRGTGPAMLLIGASDEDAEVFRAIAERLVGMTVVTYDRRGSSRSGRAGWPGGGSSLHADDAAELMSNLGLARFSVFGASAGGIVALRLALRHPELVERALVFEPGLFCHLPGGEPVLRTLYASVEDHLGDHPDDWAGALEVLGRAISANFATEESNFFSPPPRHEWYTDRTVLDAEALIREDLDLTLETISETELGDSEVPISFAFGSGSLGIFRDIATELASVRSEPADRIEGVGHAVYYSPDVVASYIRAAVTATGEPGGP